MKKYKISIFARTNGLIMYAKNKKDLWKEIKYIGLDKLKIVNIQEVKDEDHNNTKKR